MFEISTESSFSAAHHLNRYDGPCENVHGHNWQVRAVVRCEKLDPIGIGMDFRTFKAALTDVLKELDHSDLNALFEKKNQNPSSENCAQHIFEKLEALVANNGCNMVRVEVTETPGNTAAYYR
ncbi:MAG TPA: 6-carboxytetrahydropterin synthase [Chitinivibrionales bacterium]|nr:6-carboxytetrahydropterin synthase [Chitinivibrionales bacterium]